MFKKFLLWLITVLFLLGSCIPAGAFVKEFAQGEYDVKYQTEGGYDAGYDPDYNCNELDTQEVKYYIDEYFTFGRHSRVWQNGIQQIHSGWDVRLIGGSLWGDYYNVWKLIDDNDKLPVEAIRKFEDAKSGELTLEFTANFNKQMDGASFRIYGNRTVAVGLTTNDNKWYLEQPGGEKEYLDECILNNEYGVRAIFNVEDNSIKRIFLNGKTVAQNKPFANSVERVNSFSINTGNNAVGELSLTTVQLFRGYKVYDRFIAYGGNLPDDFVVESGNAELKQIHDSTRWDIYSLLLGGNNADAVVTKSFDNTQGRLEYGFSMIVPEKADGVNIGLMNDEETVLGITTKNNKLCYVDATGNEIPFYDYWQNVWYKIRADIDLTNKTAALYLNNRVMADNIQLPDVMSVNAIRASFKANGNKSIRLDDYLLQPYIPEPEDYVPEPQMLEKDGDYLLGMQFCPMWMNGHHVGWDSINYDKDRLPYLGYYDENSPETIDWMIKQMVEHGIDFARITWCQQPTDDPTNNGFIGNSWIGAYQKAKYKNMIDFMLIWENSTMGSSADKLVNAVGPYWIEHYLKDENYLKINGRPVISFISGDSFVKGSGSIEAAAAGIATFRQMCIDAGVGNPFITCEGIKSVETLGFDGIASYFGSTESTRNQISKLESNYKDYNGKTSFAPALTQGIDGTVWQTNVSGWLTPKEFKNLLVYTKEEYMPKLLPQNVLRNMIIFDTYDEYGEGHFHGPCGLYGFAYFDMIREAFVGDNEHIDVVPTMAQKDRFNNLYPYGRNIGQISKPLIGNTPVEELNSVKKWSFNGSSTQGWINGGGISGFALGGGVLSGTSSNNDPQLIVNNVDLDLTGVTHVKVKWSVDTPGSYMQVFFSTKESPGFTGGKSSLVSTTTETVANGMHEVYINMSANKDWVGTLSQLRVDPTSFSGVNFKLESIELLYDEDLAQKIKAEEAKKPQTYSCLIDSAEYKFTNKPVQIGTREFVSLREVTTAVGKKLDYDYYNNCINILSDKLYTIKLDTNTVLIDDNETKLKSGAYAVVNGSTYVDSKFVKTVFGSSIELVTENGNAEPTVSMNTKEMLWDFYSNDMFNGWILSKSLGNVYLKNSWLNATIAGPAPILQTANDININISNIESIDIKYLNETNSSKLKLYFTTDSDTSWTEGKCFEVNIKANDAEGDIYNIVPNFGENKNEILRKLRLVLGDSQGNIAIDYVKINLLEN